MTWKLSRRRPRISPPPRRRSARNCIRPPKRLKRLKQAKPSQPMAILVLPKPRKRPKQSLLRLQTSRLTVKVINQQASRKSKEYIKSGGFPPLLFENNYMKMIPSVTNRELDETFIYQGLSWQPSITSRGDLGITGPFCKRCNVSLAGGVVKCWNCNADYSKILDSDLVELRSKAHKIYEANARSKYPVINFDIPP